MELEMTAKLLMGAAAVVWLWFIVKGLIDMQRINAGAADVIETKGVVRQLKKLRGGKAHVVLTLNVDEDVAHVDCDLPSQCRRKYQVTDVVTVLWRKDEKRAVAVQTIRNGQRMFLIGFLALAVTVTLYALMF